jgi:hypothetical protein
MEGHPSNFKYQTSSHVHYHTMKILMRINIGSMQFSIDINANRGIADSIEDNSYTKIDQYNKK